MQLVFGYLLYEQFHQLTLVTLKNCIINKQMAEIYSTLFYKLKLYTYLTCLELLCLVT